MKSTARKTDTKAKVQRVAARLFEARGYHGTSMDEVAAGVGLNKGTLYYYFPGKADILYSICADILDEFVAATAVVELDLPPAEALAQLLRFQLRTIVDRPHDVVVYLQETRWIKQWLSPAQYRALREKEKVFSGAVATLVERGIADGSFAPVDVKVATYAVIGMTAWVYQWFRPKGRLSIDEVAEEMVRFAFAGLGAHHLRRTAHTMAPPRRNRAGTTPAVRNRT